MERPVSAGALLFVIVGGYLFGSLPTGFLVARAMGIDIRAHGSGNIGATNAFRILGRPAGTLVLLLDAAKGAAAVLILPRLAAGIWPVPDVTTLAIAAALAAVLGHNYTCWLRFKGGKGIATSAGVLAALAPWALIITLSTFLIVLWVSRYVSLGSVVAAAILPIATWITGAPPAVLALNTLLGLMAIWKHRSNLRRLWAGTERRVGSKVPTPVTAGGSIAVEASEDPQ